MWPLQCFHMSLLHLILFKMTRLTMISIQPLSSTCTGSGWGSSRFSWVFHVLLPSNAFQLLLGDPKLFPAKMRFILPPVSSWSILGSPSSWLCRENLHRFPNLHSWPLSMWRSSSDISALCLLERPKKAVEPCHFLDQRCRCELLKQNMLLTMAAPGDPVHKYHKQDQRQGKTLAESNTHWGRAW